MKAAVFAAALSLVACAAATSAAAEPPAVAPPAGLPEGIAPLPEAAARRLAELMREAERIRGLTAKHQVPSGVVEEKDLPARIAESLREDLPPERLRAAESGLKAFGLLPESLDLVRYYPELLASQVAGYYDPERHYLTVVHRNGSLLGKALDEKLGGESKDMEEMVLVHELTHALQDQYFDLERFVDGDPLSDEGTARTALVEGDASLVMFDFFAGVPIETVPGAGDSLRAALAGAEGMAGVSPDLPGVKEMAAAPAWLRETMEFSYLEGYLFCASVRQKGGQELLDRAFREDPPRSSEQILHPEKWHTRRDDPVALPWPDLAGRLPGAREVVRGQLGELGVRILLREAGADRAAAERAAAGWGGDRFAVYERDGRRLLAWNTVWDSAEDAKELRAAARRLGRGWTVTAVGPRRVVVLRGAFKRGEEKALRSALAAAGAT